KAMRPAREREDRDEILAVGPQILDLVPVETAPGLLQEHLGERRERLHRVEREPLMLTRGVVDDDERNIAAGATRLEDERHAARDLPAPSRHPERDLDAHPLEARPLLQIEGQKVRRRRLLESAPHVVGELLLELGEQRAGAALRVDAQAERRPLLHAAAALS